MARPPYQDSVVKLYSGGVLKEVPERGGEGQQVVWDPSLPHLGEGVVHQPGIQPRHKRPCDTVFKNIYVNFASKYQYSEDAYTDQHQRMEGVALRML